MERLNPLWFLLGANCLVFVTWTMVQGTTLEYGIQGLDGLLGGLLGRLLGYMEDDEEDGLEFPPEIIRKKSFARDSPIDIPDGAVYIDIDNGWRKPDVELFLEDEINYKKYKKRRKKRLVVSYITEKDYDKFSQGPEKELESHPHQNSDIETQMEIIFLSPNKWSGREGMLTRPLSFFASAFSHNTLGHIVSNMLTLHHMRGLIGSLGARRFSQLYLFSIITSEAVNICWYEFGASGKWSQGHGASGALSGLLAFCLVCADSQSYYNYAGFKVNKALVSCLALFSDDIAGMLKSQEIFGLSWLLKKQFFGGEETFEESSEEFKKNLGSVGFAAHIGGALGGVLFAFWFF
ncbi:hypothetical protein TrLO_g1231 [Triparma laevis f. longispina]|uniref:Peptidase S54 rhomboid domain-containing protein n=1 Tax=Triparma laevis f. longispina TaxID=1714387 RepID=A0A9W7AXG1_9STRA|nr:hypothetical protein TrLO_g1231 [Triparma laevis f. longispina]